MEWFIFALIGAFFAATYYMLVKKFLKNINLYILGSGTFLTAFIILFLISLFRGIPKIGLLFYPSVLAAVFTLIISVILEFKALKITDLSLVLPIMSFTPVFLIFTSFILLGELPSIVGAIGIALVVIGSYVLNIDKKRIHILEPFKEIFKNKGMFYMLIVAFISAVGSDFDKLIVLNTDTIFGHSISYLLTGTIFLIISYNKNPKDLRLVSKKDLPKLAFLGILVALVAITVNIAFTTQIVPYVISLKRFSILFGVFYGYLIFKEEHIFKRSIATLIMIAGAILMILF